MYIKDFQGSFILHHVMIDILKPKIFVHKIEKFPASQKKFGLYYQHEAFNNFCGEKLLFVLRIIGNMRLQAMGKSRFWGCFSGCCALETPFVIGSDVTAD